MADLDSSSTFQLTLLYPSQPILFKKLFMKRNGWDSQHLQRSEEEYFFHCNIRKSRYRYLNIYNISGKEADKVFKYSYFPCEIRSQQRE